MLGTSIGLAASLGMGGATWANDAFRSPSRNDFSTLFLTWWTDPTTTMVIQWVGPESPEAQSVSYTRHGSQDKVDTAAVRTKPFPDKDLKVHRCELEGLEPGTEYEFRIGTVSPTYRFRTMPSKATNTFQFVTGGDCGVNDDTIRTNIIAAKQEPAFAFIGGDLAYDNGKSAPTFLQFLQNYSRHMVDPQKRLIPMLSCIGNHEVQGGFRRTRGHAPYYLSVFDGIYDDPTYGVLDFGDYLSLVILDSDHVSHVEGEQTAWLEKTLADRQERPHLLAAYHVPCYPSHRDFAKTGDRSRKHWCPLFEKYKIDAVLEHHDHTFKRTFPLTDGRYDKNGVLYLGDGSWGRLKPLVEPVNRPYLATYGSSFHISVHRLEGNERFHVALDDSGRVADVCRTENKRASRRG
jgi:hypothetical protein